MFQVVPYRAYNKAPVELYLECGISTEGLADTFAAVKDIVGHSFRTVKVNVAHFKKDYSRSDFQQFYSAHKARLNLFLKNPARKLVDDTFLPMPDGMKGTYPEVLNVLVPFVCLPFGEIIVKINECAQGIIDILNDTYKDEKQRLSAIQSKIDAYPLDDVLKQTNELKEQLPKLFVKGRVTSSTVGEQFKDKKEVVEIVDKLLACGDRFKVFLNHQKDVQAVEKTFNNLVQAMSKVDRKLKPAEKKLYGELLYRFIKDIAIFNDYYGICLSEVLRIEGKFMICLRQMMDAAK